MRRVQGAGDNRVCAIAPSEVQGAQPLHQRPRGSGDVRVPREVVSRKETLREQTLRGCVD
jgi:hypothetical protein